MKEIKAKEKVAKDIVTAESEFKGYTIEEIRFQRALVAMESDFCKAKIMRSWNNLQRINPLSPVSKNSFSGKTGSIALKLINGLNYMDYALIGFSLFNGVRKFTSFFRRRKK